MAPSVGLSKPAAGGAEHREELARSDGEVGLAHGDVVVEAFRDVVDLDDGSALGAGRVVTTRLFHCGDV
jgi:hypothetical protein